MKGRKPKIIIDNDAIDQKIIAPKWFSKEARMEWNRVFPSLQARKVLTKPDLGMLEAYCTAVGVIRQCEADIQKNGLVVSTNTGPKRNPAYSMQSDATKNARQLAAELGLTPVSRSRPTVRGDNEDEGFGEYDL